MKSHVLAMLSLLQDSLRTVLIKKKNFADYLIIALLFGQNGDLLHFFNVFAP